MPFDEELGNRVRGVLKRRKGFVEKKMFGGLGFMLNGNMCLGVWKDNLIARVGPEVYEEALKRSFVREFDITGRPMRGWVMVEPEGIALEEELREWAQTAIIFVRSLPTKT